MIKVLFVCYGNICRSPMAEFILKDMVKKRGLENEFVIESAATSSEEIYNGIGNPVYGPAKRELEKHGISCRGKHATKLRQSDYRKYDFIIGMEEMNIKHIYNIFKMAPEDDGNHKVNMLLEYAGLNRGISDPWYTGEFEKTYDDIKLGCEGLLETLIN